MRTRKVHLHSGVTVENTWSVPTFPMCGDYRVVDTVSQAVFAWLPDSAQCRICRSRLPFPAQVSATDEMQTTVETIVLAIHRIGQTEHEHRCWFDEERSICTCGAQSCVRSWWTPWRSIVRGVDGRIRTWGMNSGDMLELLLDTRNMIWTSTP